MAAYLSTGTSALKLGASIDVVAPGMCSCPYHSHRAQEEMFIVLEGDGTLRVAGKVLPITASDIMFIPPGPEYPQCPRDAGEMRVSGFRQICRDDAASDGTRFDAVQRTELNVDYWNGEP